MRRIARILRSQHSHRLIAIALLITVGLFYFTRAYGVDFPLRSLQLGSALASATTDYRLSFQLAGSEVLGSIKLQLCSNSPLLADSCTAPAGFDISSAALTSQSGETGFTILASGTDANTIVLTRFPANTTSSGVLTYTFSGVVNPASNGTFFARVQTFASSDASGADTEEGGMAMSVTTPIQISTYVPPYLLFCLGVTITAFDCSTASGNYVNFGNLSDTSTASGTTQMLTATNAGNGFSITVNGTTMISGTNAITGMSAADVSRPGTSQFGMNLVANTTPSVGVNPQGGGGAAPAAGYGVSNFYKFIPGDIVASYNNSDLYKKFTTSYIVNIPKGQAVGVYVSTLTYICTASF